MRIPLLIREATGLVEAVGENVTTFKVGDSVAHLSPSCYAEYSTVSAGNARGHLMHSVM